MRNLRNVVMSLNYGKIYPYSTGISLKQIKQMVKQRYKDTTKFDNHIQMCELIGITSFVDLPETPNNIVGRISLHFNRNNEVRSITIDIKNFEEKLQSLLNEMCLKFGNPASIDSRFIIWREKYMVINIDKENGSISVLDERQYGY